jgi:hypothetical protein
MPKRTNPFQKLITSILATFYEPDYLVEESILEINPRTGIIREIDIRITELKNPNNRIMIECRDRSRAQDVLWIDELAGKSQSLGYSKVIGVSSKGFTKNALIEAEDRGIEVLQLVEAEERDWKQWAFALKELGLEITTIELVDVGFGIDIEWNGDVPLGKKFSEIFLVDKRNSEQIPLNCWIDELQKNPQQLSFMEIASNHGLKNPIFYTHNCSPEMGLDMGDGYEFIPIVQLKVTFNYKVGFSYVPLDHKKFDDERYLIGETTINNIPTQLVIHESKDRIITILLEDKNLSN